MPGILLRKAIMNVGIRYFDKKLVEESLRGYLKEIEEKHPEVKRVLLFGFLFGTNACLEAMYW